MDGLFYNNYRANRAEWVFENTLLGDCGLFYFAIYITLNIIKDLLVAFTAPYSL